MERELVKLDEDFPLLFKIRVNPSQNYSFLKKMGYHNYVSGSKANYTRESFIGWTGENFTYIENHYMNELESLVAQLYYVYKFRWYLMAELEFFDFSKHDVYFTDTVFVPSRFPFLLLDIAKYITKENGGLRRI